jgi:ankyrin repeat protein
VAFAESNRVEIARALLDAGANVNQLSAPTKATVVRGGRTTINNSGASPLHNAVTLRRVDLVTFFLARGAKVDIGTVPVVFNAVLRGDAVITKLLLKAGAKTQVLDQNGLTPLHLAAVRPLVAEVLIDHGANIDAADPRGFTPLMYAANEGNVDVVSMLLPRHPNLAATTKVGNTALHLAADQGHSAIVVMLLAAGANPSVQNTRKQTPLMAAAYQGDYDIAKALLDMGADRTLKDAAGKTAIDVAVERGHSRVVVLLRGK